MTNFEFSNSFDTQLNSYSDSTNGIVLDEYEKSYYLTKSQEQLTIDLYTGRGIAGTPFELTEELRSYIRGLIQTSVLSKVDNTDKNISAGTQLFKLPSDVLFIIYERATIDDEKAACRNCSTIPIIPVTHDEYNRIIENPFRGPSDRRALRLDSGTFEDTSLNFQETVELVSKYNLSDYRIRYIKRPTPIVLCDLSEMGAFPEVEGKATECILNPILHPYILDRAVQLALSRYGIQNKQ